MKPLSQEKLDDFRTNWQKRATQEQRRLQQRYQKGRKLAENIAQLLVDRYDADQVYLTGSLAEKETAHEKTDIDLVVRGLDTNRYFSALAESFRLLEGEFHLDLIPYEDANEAMKQSLQERGELLTGMK